MSISNARESPATESRSGSQVRYGPSVSTTSFCASAFQAAASAAAFFFRFLLPLFAPSLCASLFAARFNSARVVGAFGGFGGVGTGGSGVGSGGASGSGVSRPAI